MTGALVTALGREECFALLGTQVVGRFAVGAPDAGPLVVPVNFVVDGDRIVFRSDLGSKTELLSRAFVSFQVDAIDWCNRTGWSVLARGMAYEADHAKVGHMALDPWAEGDKLHWVVITVTEITGRRLTNAELAWAPDSHGYL